MTEVDQVSSDELDLDKKELQEAYQNMYSQQLRVCAEKCSLESRYDALFKLNEKTNIKVQILESLISEKDKKLKKVLVEFERTQKSLKILNFGTSKLDDILSVGKTNSNHTSLIYKGEKSESKTVFVKAFPPFVATNTSIATKTPIATNTIIATCD